VTTGSTAPSRRIELAHRTGAKGTNKQ
jgi:hypothetical protein